MSDNSASPTLIDALIQLWRTVLGRTGDAANRGFNSYIAAEHRCYPPDDGRNWVPVPSSSTAPGQYICPECEQHFAPSDGG